MQLPQAIFKAKLTHASIPDANGRVRGMPGYTYVDIVAEMADGSSRIVANVYAPQVMVKYHEDSGTVVTVRDEESNFRANYYVHSYEWMN